MTHPETPAPGPAPSAATRTDYAGAVYGSLLAASVVATASLAGELPRLKLALMLIITGLVFWAAHAYAHWVGERQLTGTPWAWGEIRRVSRREWSIVEAAVLPTVAVAISPVLGLGLSGTAWLALAVAVAQQVTWACLGAVKASASRRQVAAEGLVNLVLGLVLMAAKGAISH